jgi:hypothetical protein
MPSQRDAISQGKFTQTRSGGSFRKSRIGHQQLNVTVQLDWTMHLRLDLGIEHPAQLSLGWFPARLLKIFDDVSQ